MPDRRRTPLEGQLTPEEALLSKSYDVLRRLPSLIRALCALVIVTAVLQIASHVQLNRRNNTLDNIERIVLFFEDLATDDDPEATSTDFNLLVLEGLRKIELLCQQFQCEPQEE